MRKRRAHQAREEKSAQEAREERRRAQEAGEEQRSAQEARVREGSGGAKRRSDDNAREMR